MRLIRGLAHIEPMPKGCVLTIGNFDGLHLGHRAVIDKLARQGRGMGLPSVALIFEPQPLEYFQGRNAPSRLTRLREKIIQFSASPIDRVLILRFNRYFADLEAEAFIEDILLKRLNVKYLVVGDDFHFGKARRGNFAMLKEKGLEFGFQVEDTPSYQLDGHRVSSTMIRDALGEGDLDYAASMLGRSYSVCGRVAYGDKIGRTIGFPTANIQLSRKNTPIEGVFAVVMTGIDGREIPGVANVGTRPTVGGGSKVILETHLFDFNRDIYGHYVEVHFKKKIRNEMRFPSLTELKAQIVNDVAEAKKILLI
ncbi:bifunctional riboflavin kinase/FAD synthetase [Methylotuvimicrobium alcaliphilum]|uniref:Riboflavin biosynthesis protein n=1 Tax=Methylotuvimicrobium alcaliphilum (strain DSM 19304 / NCIMB 14124 / VKM B-2133 / 20Z) TaxID=1091494 RepID=G4SWL6_META2|nr:bifunctional riboflavin kinase/FAD synthetase [Methylotuvimicrobium alcaliphilum]CCE25242.1 bifunctional riboflavin biosynthesis protein RibF [Includes: Riboflavin kinase (Flavokinase); FMN adenylyltransferase (FAD pyrophosphorylase) (FAD synthetase)] [Methylotuvimicrobium alcaliphilum 20Z]